MAQSIIRADCKGGREVTVAGLVKQVYDSTGFSLIPVDFTQIDARTVLLHAQPAGNVWVKYKKITE